MTAVRPIVSFVNLGVRFGETVVLEDVTAAAGKGRLTAIIGPNGAGKTTLLKAIIGAVEYTGMLTLDAPRTRVGYVPQRLEMDRGLPVTVAEFLALLMWRRPLIFGLGATRRRRIDGILERVGARSLADKSLGALSGGEAQRVLLAAALEPLPELLLLDEPASGMDLEGESRLYDILKGLIRDHGVSIIMVSHDLSVVSDLTDHVLCVNRRLICEGGPDSILTDETIAHVFGSHHGVYHHTHDHKRP